MVYIIIKRDKIERNVYLAFIIYLVHCQSAVVFNGLIMRNESKKS